MRAAIYERYGAPDVVHLAGRAKPTPAAGEVLVRVDAASVGASDNAARSGEPGLVRLFSGIRSPRLPVLGSEYAGEIVAVGSGVTGLEVGDRVYGATGAALGCHAEHITVRADSALASLPPGVTPSQAVAFADGCGTTGGCGQACACLSTARPARLARRACNSRTLAVRMSRP